MKPFPGKIAWGDFSFTFPAEEAGIIIDTLRAVPVEKLEKMQVCVGMLWTVIYVKHEAQGSIDVQQSVAVNVLKDNFLSGVI